MFWIHRFWRAMRTVWMSVLVGLALTAVALGLRLADPTPVANARLAVFDQFQRLAPRVYEPAPVRVVTIDNHSLEAIGQWPWPRLTLADLTDRLFELGAAAVAFDIVFSEPDRSSPSRLALDLLLTSEQVQQIDPRGLLDYDQVFADTLARGPSVVGFVLTDLGQSAAPPRQAGIAVAGSAPQRLPQYSGVVSNLDPLAQAAAGSGFFSITPDADGLFRRVALVQQLDDQIYPALSVEALRVAQGAGTLVLRTTDASGEVRLGQPADVGLQALRIGAIEVPTTATGEMWVHFTTPVPERLIPASRVLAARGAEVAALQALIAGHIVLIGATAEGLLDVRATPLSRQTPGVTIHAQALEQMILGHHLVRPDWAEGAEVLALVVMGLAMTALTIAAGPLWSAVGGACLLVGLCWLSWQGFTGLGLLMDPVYPSVAGGMVYLGVAVIRWMQTEQRRQAIRLAFSRYLAPDLVSHFAETGDPPELKSDSRYVTIMFSDVRGFTSLCERLDHQPERLVTEINGLLGPMTDIIHRNTGNIDKYIGDCIMAIWNAPNRMDRHEAASCRAALAMRAKIQEINQARFARHQVSDGGSVEGFIPLDMGIGINTGYCTVGNMGSASRYDYSAIGNEVNVAARFESLSKYYRCGVVIGEQTYLSIKYAFAALELDVVAPKGKAEGVRVFALLGDQSLRSSPGFQRLHPLHSVLLNAYRDGDVARAERALMACREALTALPSAGRSPDFDGLYGLYEDRIAAMRLTPPPSGWDGVYRPDSK